MPLPLPLRRIAALAAACALVGCKTRPEARYVARSADMGTIAMPEDTPENRERALALMHSHFPEGFEIVAEGEDAVLAPPPPIYGSPIHDPMWHHHRRMTDPVAMAHWNEPGFQRSVEDLPGTPQSMQGYAQQPVPSVGVHVGDLPARPAGVIRSEWRITYRKKGSTSATPHGEQPQSLFPELQQTSDKSPTP